MNASTRPAPRRAAREPDFAKLVRADRIHGSIYTDPAVFDVEMERIFHAGWVYVGHESEIPKPGDFRTRYVGLQPVIFVRGDDNEVRVLMNRCTHRAAMVCPHEQGNANKFICPYHGWVYRNNGALSGVPHEDRYDDSFSKEDYGLRPVPRVATYRGLMFASLAQHGISLDEHLGSLAKAEIDIAFDLSPSGKIDVSAGIHKYGYNGNWKVQVENSTDGYHLGFLHRSFIQIAQERYGTANSGRLGFTSKSPYRVRSLGNGHVCWDMSMTDDQMQFLGANMKATDWQRDYAASLIAAHGQEYGSKLLRRTAAHVLIFPNLVFIGSHIRIIRPTSVSKTEVFLYPYTLNDAPPVLNAMRLHGHQSFYGPAGGGATDDLEVFERISVGLRANVDPWVLINRGFGREETDPDGSISGQITDELNSRAIYQRWKEMICGDSANTSRTGRVKG